MIESESRISWRYAVTDPLSVMLMAVIVACTYPLVLLLPRDPLVRRWQARRYVRRLRKGLR
jgi:hypothetical protein